MSCYTTYRIHKEGQEVARFCSFKKKWCAQGNHWHVHKAKLQPADFSDLKRAMVKVCPRPNVAREECEAEAKKLYFAEIVVELSDKLKDIGVADTYEAEVNKDEHVTCGMSRSRSRAGKVVSDGTKVLVQDCFPGQIRPLFDMEEEKSPCWDPATRSCFHDLALESYRLSGGRWVITAVKGVKLGGNRGRTAGYGGPVRYLITSLTVHSTAGEFGRKDKGKQGVQAFLESAGTAVPAELSDHERLVEKLKKKRERGQRRQYYEATFLAEETALPTPFETSPGNSSDNAGKVKESTALFGVALKALVGGTSVWSSHPSTRNFMGSRVDEDEDYQCEDWY